MCLNFSYVDLIVLFKNSSSSWVFTLSVFQNYYIPSKPSFNNTEEVRSF